MQAGVVTYVRGIISAAESDTKLVMQGVALPGDMLFSLDLYAPTMTYRDLIRLDLADVRSGESYPDDIIKRRRGDTDELVREPSRIDMVAQDHLEDGTTTVYQPSVDYTIYGKIIAWIGTNKPERDSYYGVYYHAYHDYLVFVPPAIRIERNQLLGQRVLLRRTEASLIRQHPSFLWRSIYGNHSYRYG